MQMVNEDKTIVNYLLADCVKFSTFSINSGKWDDLYDFYCKWIGQVIFVISRRDKTQRYFFVKIKVIEQTSAKLLPVGGSQFP